MKGHDFIKIQKKISKFEVCMIKKYQLQIIITD